MKTLEKKLSVASTSALVLAAVKSLYADGWGREYLSRIDFSPVEKMAEDLIDITPLFRDVMLLRKRMVRYLIKQLMIRHNRQQVCILAAGLDPLGLQIAEYFPEQLTSIYEVDNAHMNEKQQLYASVSFNDARLHNVQADITNTTLLMESLIAAGYNPHKPTLVVFEGIMHYISEEQFLRIMRSFCSRTRNNAVIMDYIIPDEDIPAGFLPTAKQMFDVVEKGIGSRLKQFSRKKILNLLSLLEADLFDVYDMQAAEYVLNGHNKLYHNRGEGILEIVAFHI